MGRRLAHAGWSSLRVTAQPFSVRLQTREAQPRCSIRSGRSASVVTVAKTAQAAGLQSFCSASRRHLSRPARYGVLAAPGRRARYHIAAAMSAVPAAEGGSVLIVCGGKNSEDVAKLNASLEQVDAGRFGVRFTPASAPETSSNMPKFSVDTYLGALRSNRIGRCVLAGRELGSTQALVSDNVAVLPSGTVCVVDVQTSGKGRGSNTWTSPEGCLMFSFTTRLKDGRTLPLLQYVVTLAIVEAVQQQAAAALGPAAAAACAVHLQATSERGAPPPPRDGYPTATEGGAPAAVVDVRIKWPNDVYSGGLKIGGVLCQSAYAPPGEYAVTVGVGLNVSNSQPSTCVNDIVAAAAAAAGLPAPDRSVSAEALLAAVLSRYEQLEAAFAERGFATLQSAYLFHWLHSGQEVSLVEDGRPEPVRLTVVGLTPSGYLLAVDGLGAESELHPDGNSLDFFQGLIRRKLP